MKVVHDLLFKRSSTYAIVIFGSSFFFERTYDIITDQIFKSANKGKLWEDIKHKYE